MIVHIRHDDDDDDDDGDGDGDDDDDDDDDSSYNNLLSDPTQPYFFLIIPVIIFVFCH